MIEACAASGVTEGRPAGRFRGCEGAPHFLFRKAKARTLAEVASELDALRQAARIAGLGHYLWDVVEDRCLFCSEEHAEIHGMSVDDYLESSSTLDGLSHPDDLPIVQEAFRNLQAGDAFELEYRIITPGGELRYIREIGHPIKDDDGTVVREIGTSQDITRQKLREITLSDAERAIHTSIEALPFGFASYGPDDRLEYFNSEYNGSCRTAPIC